MSVIVIILAVLAGVIGIVGSVIPALPGPPVSWLGLMILYFWGNGTDGAGDPMSLTFLLVWLGITVAVCIIDYLVPAWFTKLTGGTKAAGRGALVGLLAGMFIRRSGSFSAPFSGRFSPSWPSPARTDGIPLSRLSEPSWDSSSEQA